nr:protein FAR1-related sequence 5-like [Tanacetum cinerariifolium]
MNLNNMELSRARRQLHFDDYIFIHRASMSNLAPTRAHRLKAALVGGYDKVRGTSIDNCNFKCCVNSFIGDRDAQMLVDKMCKRKLHVLEFCFEYHTLSSKELVKLFWADETMKCNYVAFGNLVSFDATLHTNKYGYKFVPFTGIDHNQRCVTFGAALLSDETTESFSWMLEAFLKTHKKQPPFAVTDQDGALRKAVVKMFLDSHHRLCMWHITEKLPEKVLGDLAADTNFRKDFHKLVCNVYIGPDVFEQRWNDMISRYNLHDNKWLSDMYAIKERWVPGFFKDVPMCGLMKTTSRSESSNAFFQIYSHEEECIGLFKNDTDKLSELLSTVQDLKKKLENEMQTPHVALNKDDLYSNLLDVTVPDKVVIMTPKSIFKSKGTRRIKSAAKKSKAKAIARSNRKVPFKRRTCNAYGGKGHNKSTCERCSDCGEPGHHKGICKKFPNQDKDGGSGKNIVVDDEDEGDTDDQFDDEALGATEEEFDMDDEVDKEYESDEE